MIFFIGAWILAGLVLAFAFCKAAAKPVPPAGGYDEEDDL